MAHYTLRSVFDVFGHALFCVVVMPVLLSCGGGGGGAAASYNRAGAGSAGDNSTTSGWTAGEFLPASTFAGRCVAPEEGTGDIAGTATDENNFLRSYSNDTYLWYDEIIDRDPAQFTTPDYFDLLRTGALTPSGNLKDKFHFTMPSEEWNALSQASISVGYGAQFAIVQSTPPRQAVVAYTEPATPAAAANLTRGAQILAVDGVDVAYGNDIALNAGLFPETAGESHTFRVRDRNGTERTITMQSAVIAFTPVQNVSTIPTLSGNVGYLLFNDHAATAEGGLYDAITQLARSAITDLVVDLRYNGGGFLDIASEFAYMIAGAAATAGRPFEALKFNAKHPLINPVTMETLQPVPFHTRSQGFDPVLPEGTALPTLNLARVYVLTGRDTCSASESIINGLRGVDVQVIQIGSTTCGKPYGFYPSNNCGTTYFTIQFQGVNAKGFGDYTDGFSPANATSNIGTVVPGCSVRDDFSNALGDPAEARLAAALTHSVTGACPLASGFSRSNLQLLQTAVPAREMVVPKSSWQQNRSMRP